MFAFLKRAFVLLLALLLVAALIWIVGPWIEIRDYAPLGSVFARLVAIGVVVACWLVSVMLRWFRAKRTSGQLALAVMRQAPPEKEQVSPEAAKLRERFEEAVNTLTRNRGRSLYELPWYIFIGAPGSGKTTALVNSGLRFPLEQRVGKAAIRGVGGTRNCDWWFTDDAVFLDTAGRYTTQDSDPTADSEGWKEFLALLRKYRKRRPINGVILTLSAQDLMTQGDAGREAHVEAAHRRLRELATELRIQLPVYLMVTKCDVVAGFLDYFDDLPLEGRTQVWGVTFPYDQTLSGAAADAYPAEFDALMERLNARSLGRVEQARGVRQKAAVFAFPQQMAALRDSVSEFVRDVFSAAHRDRQILLRGVYFTSGTQDGTQIDRLLGAISRRFGIAPEAVAPPPGRGKAFFIDRLLKEVVIGESGIAGVNRRLEARSVAWLLAAYAAIALVVAIGVTGFSASYAANRSYIGQVATDVATLKSVPPASATVMPEGLLPRLDALRAVSESANRYKDDRPWRMRWGLYQGNSLGEAARDAYVRELDSQLLPRFAARIRQRLISSAGEPELLFEYLKAYVMLGEPEHLDKAHLQFLADHEWKTTQPEGTQGVSLATHFASLLENRDVLRPLPIDVQLVAQARSSLAQSSIPRIMYGQVQRHYAEDTRRALRIDEVALGVDKVLRRKSGRPLSEPIPSLYTKAVFNEVTGAGMATVAARFAKDSWVWGAKGNPVTWVPTLTQQVTDVYEADYIRAWEAELNDLELAPFPTVPQYAEALRIIVGPPSPLRALLQAVVENTSLVAAPADAATAQKSITDRLKEGATDLFNRGSKMVTGRMPTTPGARVTARFQPIQRLLNGSPAPIDGIIDQLKKIREQLARVGPQIGGTSQVVAVTDPALIELRRALAQDATTLPSPVDGVVGQLAATTTNVLGRDAAREIDRLYRQDVVRTCHTLLDGRFPFSATRIDLPLNDFGEVFGYGGVYDRFFATNLEKLVDTTRTPWAWRPDTEAPSPGMLAQFEQAARIRRMFFQAGSKSPKLSFVVGLSNLDLAATRFYLMVEGQNVAVRPGEEIGRPVDWPGPQGAGIAFATFEDRIAAPVRALEFSGPWAWFRFVDASMDPAQLQAQPGQNLFTVLTVQTPQQHRVRITVQAPNAEANPFGVRDWRRFTCGS